MRSIVSMSIVAVSLLDSEIEVALGRTDQKA